MATLSDTKKVFTLSPLGSNTTVDKAEAKDSKEAVRIFEKRNKPGNYSVNTSVFVDGVSFIAPFMTKALCIPGRA